MSQQIRLDELRRAREMTQIALAERLGMDQSGVSKLERRTDMYLSTLRNYIEAIGGVLEVRAVFADQAFKIDVTGGG